MNNNIISDYNDNGFYIAKGLLSQETIQESLFSIKNHFDNQLSLLGVDKTNDIYLSMQKLYNLDLDIYKKTVGSIWRKLSIYNLLHHKNIQSFVEDIFGWNDIVIPGGQVIHIQANSLKIPNGYFGLNVHQDFPSVQGSLDGFVVWIPLVDIDANRFPLELIPKSHKNGILPSFKNKQEIWEVKSEYYNENDFIPAICEVGDVIFMSNFTIHRSSINGDDRLRLACSTRYDNANEISFIKRCYPSAYIRSVHREQFFDFI